MKVPTREEYEKELNRLQGLINKADDDFRGKEREVQSKLNSSCAGMHGWRVPGVVKECDGWKGDVARNWASEKPGWKDRIENAKSALWDYQKAVAKAEQDAQIEAVRQAIADQVRIEQERILQSQQNQMIIEQAPPPEPEPKSSIPPAKFDTHQQIGETITPFKLPFHHNYLIPIIAIGGYLVLRN
jgi:hypothetical protein